MNPLIQLKRAIPLSLVALACFALSPMAQAQLPPPPPDGGYPNNNTVEGDLALFNVTTGHNNTAIGFKALNTNSNGSFDTATGSQALFSNQDGFANTATGFNTLFSNTRGSSNTAVGFETLFFNNTGHENTATGVEALFNNTTGSFNTASGEMALMKVQTGDNNIAVGYRAGSNITTGSNNIDIGALGAAGGGESNTIRIGTHDIQYHQTYIQGISGVAVNGSQVVVNANGQLGVTTSSARFKQDIEPMDKASEKILALKPVTFRYKKQIDPDKTPQFGLVAEEVEKVNSDLVIRDKDGKPYTVRYEAVNAMLLNEFLKARRQIDAQQKQIDALAAGLQRVSAQFEASKPAPQMVNNP